MTSTVNLGILAHVDAGKTSLSERLLHTAGVIDELGSVDAGSTQTDSMDLERQRGITIRAAVASFVADGVAVNLIDTPGHPDFIAEVERVLRVLDGAVLVVSAVEGVQAQTRVLMRTLRRLAVPTLLFVNKLDRRGADPDRVLAEIERKLAVTPVPMGRGDRDADALLDALSRHDDALLATYVEHEEALSDRRLHRALVAQTRRALVHPVFFGSAITGAGVDALMAGIAELLPRARHDAAAAPSGTVFKIERGPAGENIAYLRMFSGTLRVRDRLPLGRVTGLDVFDGGPPQQRDEVRAGQIAKVRGLTDARIGAAIGAAGPRDEQFFAPPALETIVRPRRRGDKGALHAALAVLAEQDPLINLRLDDEEQEVAVSLYGEVQKEVIEATLATEYGLAVHFEETTTICVETPAGPGAAVECINTATNPLLATVGLRVEPAPPGAGVRFALGVELGSMPPAFFRAVQESVHDALRAGPHGWQVVDCAVTMTHAGYWARQSHAHGTFDKSMSSTAGDFRGLTPIVLMRALRAAGTTVYEPMQRFRLETPPDTLDRLTKVLPGLDAVLEGSAARGGTHVLEGLLPAANVHLLQRRLPELTHGEGVLECTFGQYRPVRGQPPVRRRAKEYADG
ncbi:GTP-binding protein [Dactylosporangium sp. CA-139114]|uniref:GTP-binding protein n=1 Tax=Dactylosporangium sp. CA-139114 TaxID=3239931 RepID=UPI003D956BAD